ncbi:response regulator transcription factor [Candidatus Chloroploca sp. M-50]|uniref:Response regulator transcription factor n=1 Tax=Candidatus Chloroploca mongolica TaxID=2528176 RepID=A0ABS4D6K9_9CHLR|nr:response regulator transcription factor [Candidatus Chloroploca mongolica]MBP1465077.1 response regulator transcription factor [Candidatus Chloroploca mongolica]
MKVLVADDHPIVRQGLRLLLSATREFELVGEAASGAEAITLTASLAPDVVILDLIMPGMDGVTAIHGLLQAAPHVRVLILTSFTDDEKLLAALQAGAAGCIIKDSNPDDLLGAIRAVARGESALHPLVARRLLQRLQHPAPPPPAPLDALTGRERDVLRCVGQGLTNQQIADELHISIRTVHTHIRSLLDKLHLEHRTQLALFAHNQRIS